MNVISGKISSVLHPIELMLLLMRNWLRGLTSAGRIQYFYVLVGRFDNADGSSAGLAPPRYPCNPAADSSATTKQSHTHRKSSRRRQMDSRNIYRWFLSRYNRKFFWLSRRAPTWCCSTAMKMLLAFFALGAISTPALAQTCGGGICAIDNSNTSGWKLENYVPNNLVLWFVDTTNCGANGGISFPTSAVDADRNRLVTVIATAKAGGVKVFLRYNVSGSSCTFNSFGFSP